MTRPADRDDALELLLRRTSTASVPSDTTACLDAETLAAFVDGGLTGPSRAAAEAHAAGCARCQASLAMLSRATPESAAPASGWSFGALRWLVPALGASAALALWFAVDRQ